MMSRYAAKVESGVVVDVLLLSDGSKGDEAVRDLGLVEEAGVRPVIGWSWDGTSFAAPAVTWDDIRAQRDALLTGSDWTQVADAPVDAAAWAVYRQQLRDIPQNFDTPDAVVWPEAP